MQDHIINKEKLKAFGSVATLSEQAKTLLLHQKENWDLARTNYIGLSQVKVRLLHFRDFKIRVQFNPERIRSSAAKTDQKSISERPCFLCENNRPVDQKGIDFKGIYTILINPFPIFPCHLTIPLNDHWLQEIDGKFMDMLQLSKELEEFIIFYNGPKCGASAPDHFHFQAGLKNLMPIESEFQSISEKYGEILLEDEKIKVTTVSEPYMRKFILLQSKDAEELEKQFECIYNLLPIQDDEIEPMINILCSYNDGWEVVILPRDKQRPEQFFAEGDQQILMSPASAEMGGLVILPQKEDFEKITNSDLTSIYRQVTLNDKAFENLKNELKKEL